MTNPETQAAWDYDFETVRQIADPFEDGTGEVKFDELMSRMQDDHLGPEELVLRVVATLKQFAAQHIKDLDALTQDVAETWSRVERHHHRTRLRVVQISFEKRERDFIFERLTDAWFVGHDLSPIRNSRPDIWPEWEDRERHLEDEFGDLRRLWSESRRARSGSAGREAP